jgi:hypothetical protein
MTLWYLNRSNGYVEQSIGKPIDNYDDPQYTPEIDKLYTVVGAHVMIDTGEIFGQFMPSIQKLMEMAQQRHNTPPQLPPDAQVVKDTSMAETQRKTQADRARLQLDQSKLQADMQKHAEDNQTKIAIENAKLTHETIQNIAQAQTQAMPAQPQAEETMPPQPQGVQNGNI